MSTTSRREARRRRIIDGGADRLAFITGRIESLPSDDTSAPPGIINQDVAVEEEPPVLPSPSEEEEESEESSRHKPSLRITTRQLYSAIKASENIRIWCSLATALLIIFSYVLGFGSIFGLEPAYVLLVINTSSVVVKLDRRNVIREEGFSSGDLLARALEMLLLLHHIIGVLFMDLFIYAIVLISGFSLVTTLGW
ncbi:hypothetical protein M569_08792 [Genlisea aurea]|uniref:Uncharacterized protein n=1 Tax=Genlisea aurea TaxID=192259 RepID=S8CGC4_9LAMI|nr:hypothetical protein M569_08792 [Genlisea aurea]